MSNLLKKLARPARLERATCGFVVRRSIHLSYGRFPSSIITSLTEQKGFQPYKLHFDPSQGNK